MLSTILRELTPQLSAPRTQSGGAQPPTRDHPGAGKRRARGVEQARIKDG